MACRCIENLQRSGEVLESNRESITVSCDDDGDYVQIELALGGTERTIVVEDFEEIYREEA